MSQEKIRSDITEYLLSIPWLSGMHGFIHLIRGRMDSPLTPEISPIEHSSIYPLSEYTGNSPRLNGFKLDAEVQDELKASSPHATPTLPMNDIHVLDEHLYERWHSNNNQFTTEDTDLIHNFSTQILEKSGSRKATIRRAIYDQRDGTIPLASTYNGKDSPEEILDSIQELYSEYATNYPGSEYIKESMIYPYVDPAEVTDPLTSPTLPVGGVAYPQRELKDTNGRITIVIRSGYGDSAIHSTGHPQADEIIVHVKKPTKDNPGGSAYIAARTTHPVKTSMYVQRKPAESWNATPIIADEKDQTIGGEKSVMFEVPIGQRIVSPTVSDSHAISIALHLAHSMLKSGKSRKLEFSYGDTKSENGNNIGYLPYILENVSFDVPESETGRQSLGTGPLTAILNEASDIDSLDQRIHKFKQNEFPNDKPIIALSYRFLEALRLDKSLRTKLEGISSKAFIVGTFGPTEHAARSLKEKHTVATVRPDLIAEILGVESTLYQIGTRYDLLQVDGICMLVPSQETGGFKIPPFLTIEQAIRMNLVDPTKIGGKSYGLARLSENKYPIPEGTLTLTNTFFDSLIKHNRLDNIFAKLTEATSAKELEILFRKIHLGISKIPKVELDELHDRLSAISSGNSKPRFAIRSNLSIEDDGKHPMAGTFSSVLDVSLNKNELRDSILSVIKNYFREGIATDIFEQLSGRDRKEKLKSLLGSVIIQEMLDSQYSGTLFTYDTSGLSEDDKTSITLQYSLGVGGVVDGGVGKTEYTFIRKRNGEITHILIKTENGEISSIDPKTFTMLSDDDTTYGMSKHIIVGLLKLGKNCAKSLGNQQDMEWAVTKDGKITFLQSRPILTI